MRGRVSMAAKRVHHAVFLTTERTHAPDDAVIDAFLGSQTFASAERGAAVPSSD